MTAKEYLNQIRSCKVKLENDQRRLNELKEMALATGSKELKADVVQTSIANAGLEDSVGDYVDFEMKIREDIRKYLELEMKIVRQINSLHCGEQTNAYIELLLRRYDHGERFETIAIAMNYSYEYVRHLHNEALNSFEEQYRKELENG
jgi:hypothetical protein